MSKSKTVLYTGAFSFSALIMGLWGSTQWAAYRFDYHHALRGALADFGDFKLYLPWEVLPWMAAYGERYAAVFNESLWFLLFAAVIGALTPLLFLKKLKPAVDEFGKEEWGTLEDAREAGLLEGKGVVLGVMDGKLLTYNGPEHHLVSGASRSGKGVGHIVPTLLNWPESAIIYDIKDELWGLTAGWRSQFSHVLYFNPISFDSAKFNPLLEIRKGPNEIRDAQNIVDILFDPEGGVLPDIWDKNAVAFLVALVLHVLYTEEDGRKSLAVVREKILDFEKTIHEMQTRRHIIDKKTGKPAVHPEILRAANSMSAKPDRYKISVAGTAESYLTLYADEMVVENTAYSDFSIGDLMCSDNPVSLYIQPPPSDAARLSPLIRLMLSQISRSLMERLNEDSRGRTKKHKLLLLLDELPTLGKLEFLQINMGQMAGYGLKALLCVQSFNAIERAYGANNVIIDNCHIITSFASADTRTQDRVSKMTGMATEYRQSYSRPMSFIKGGRASVGESESVRPLLSHGQVRQLDQAKQLVFVTGFKPLKTDKLRYYEHEGMCKRTEMQPPDQRQGIDMPGEFGSEWFGERAKGAVTEQQYYERPKPKPYKPRKKKKPTVDEFPVDDIEIDLSDFEDDDTERGGDNDDRDDYI